MLSLRSVHRDVAALTAGKRRVKAARNCIVDA